ncbi:MAG: 50S ribosomal protein L25 [Verrucomicrobiae bacterium]|nr:50S ribosomal protein L25 [Verrucomicrobiae bacterium]
MAKEVSLTATLRGGLGRQQARKTRCSGAIPGVIYGSHTKPLPIQVQRLDITKIFKNVTNENLMVSLSLNEGTQTSNRLAFIQDIQRHPIKDEILHIDFHEVRADEKLRVHVQVHPSGEAEGVRLGGGTLEQALHSVEVECLPKDLPEQFTVDVSALAIGGNIHVREIKAPAGVTITTNGDISVFSVLAPVKEEVVAAAPAAGEQTAEPEVINQKKPEEGEAAAKADEKGGTKAGAKKEEKGGDAKAAAKPEKKK